MSGRRRKRVVKGRGWTEGHIGTQGMGGGVWTEEDSWTGRVEKGAAIVSISWIKYEEVVTATLFSCISDPNPSISTSMTDNFVMDGII